MIMIEMGTMRSAWRPVLLCVFALAAIPGQASAADLAVLRNGFTIRHDRRQVMGETTRLFTAADESSFVDVPTTGACSCCCSFSFFFFFTCTGGFE